VQFGIEIDVATFEEGNGHRGGAPAWNVPAPTQTLAVSLLSDVVEVLVYSTEGGPTLAGAIELVSPANKDRPEHHDAFVSKCAAYVQAGVGLMIVDVVTERSADLHGALVARLNSAEKSVSAPLYAASYRLVERNESPQLDLWHYPFSLDKPMPAVPLWLRGNVCLQVDLQATYERTCREQRIS